MYQMYFFSSFFVNSANVVEVVSTVFQEYKSRLFPMFYHHSFSTVSTENNQINPNHHEILNRLRSLLRRCHRRWRHNPQARLRKRRTRWIQIRVSEIFLAQKSLHPKIINNFYDLFFNSYETSDGTSRVESAIVKNFGSEVEALEVKGTYSFVADDGQTYKVDYVANENGFQPSAPHLPVGPVA